MTEQQPTVENEYAGAAQAIWDLTEVRDILPGYRTGEAYDSHDFRVSKIDLDEDVVSGDIPHKFLLVERHIGSGHATDINYLIVDFESRRFIEPPLVARRDTKTLHDHFYSIGIMSLSTQMMRNLRIFLEQVYETINLDGTQRRGFDEDAPLAWKTLLDWLPTIRARIEQHQQMQQNPQNV